MKTEWRKNLFRLMVFLADRVRRNEGTGFDRFYDAGLNGPVLKGRYVGLERGGKLQQGLHIKVLGIRLNLHQEM